MRQPTIATRGRSYEAWVSVVEETRLPRGLASDKDGGLLCVPILEHVCELRGIEKMIAPGLQFLD